jgi:hypothetical protein
VSARRLRRWPLCSSGRARGCNCTVNPGGAAVPRGGRGWTDGAGVAMAWRACESGTACRGAVGAVAEAVAEAVEVAVVAVVVFVFDVKGVAAQGAGAYGAHAINSDWTLSPPGPAAARSPPTMMRLPPRHNCSCTPPSHHTSRCLAAPTMSRRAALFAGGTDTLRQPAS